MWQTQTKLWCQRIKGIKKNFYLYPQIWIFDYFECLLSTCKFSKWKMQKEGWKSNSNYKNP